MSTGKLCNSSGKFIVNVDYQFHDKSEVGWWGELLLTKYKRLEDDERYVIELQDGRRGPCSLRKRVNRATSGVPPLYRYLFRGCGPLK